MNFNFFNSNNHDSSNNNTLSTSFLALGMGGAALWSTQHMFSQNKPDIFNFKNLNFGFNSTNKVKIFDSGLVEKMKRISLQENRMQLYSKMFFKGTNVPGYHPGHATGGGELGGAGKKMPSRHVKKMVTGEEVAAVVKEIGEQDVKSLYSTLSEKLDWYLETAKKYPVSSKEYLEDPILELKQSVDVKVVDEFQHIAKKEFVQGKEGGLSQILHNVKLQNEINAYLSKYFPNYSDHIKHISNHTKLPTKFKTLYSIMTYVVHLNGKIKK